MFKTVKYENHGWVFPNTNGVVVKCGGPALCSQCKLEEKIGKPFIEWGKEECIKYEEYIKELKNNVNIAI